MSFAPGDLVTFARGELLRRVEGASERIWLASPFLSKSISSYIALARGNLHAKLSLADFDWGEDFEKLARAMCSGRSG